MNVNFMRDTLKKQYRGARKWVNKVNEMSDRQIIAIYYRMLNAGTLYNVDRNEAYQFEKVQKT